MGNKENIKDFMIKELEIIQGIINRMANNSFLIKWWVIILVIVILLLKGNKYQTSIAFIPILVFWFLDAYFLRIERLYRRLYNWVKDNRLKTKDFLFDLNYKRFEKEEQSILRIMFSTTLGLFYGSIFGLTLIYVIFFTY
jgi:predicted histidine transporter YuiF (NhaC family)